MTQTPASAAKLVAAKPTAARSGADLPGTPPELVRILADLHRERQAPTAGDQHYPHLRDLRDALTAALVDAEGTWLDYGSATSPYADLLARATLRTADMASATWRYEVDHELGDDGTVPVPDGTFDGVLSTQVLEHVPEPADYLAEARRVLRPGGRLVLSTHGVWEDHSPVDLWRWTADGLRTEIARAGFEVDSCATLTGGGRAALHLLLRELRRASLSGWGPAALVLRAARRLDRWSPRAFDTYADRQLADWRTAPAGQHGLYLAILVTARRTN